MPILQLHATNPLIDGRQSANAMLVRRGVQRLLVDMRHNMLPELALPGGRRADLVSIGPKGEVWIIEIKSSIEDFRADTKWEEYREHCDRLWFATHEEVPLDIFPECCGLMVSTGYGAEVMREAPELRLPGATRRLMTLRFARAASSRLLRAEWAANPISGEEDGE